MQPLAPLYSTAGRECGESSPQLGEEFYRVLIESIEDVFVVLDIDGTILFASPSVESAYGYHPSELTGKNAADFVHPDSRSDLTALLRDSIFGQRSASRVPLIAVRLKDNSFRSFKIAAKILQGKSRPLGIVVTAHDATDLSVAESALHRQKKAHQGLFKNMIDGYAHCRMEYDTQGEPVDWIYIDTNAAFERITGLTKVEGRRVTEVIPGIKNSNPELFEIYGRVAQDGLPARFETRIESLGMWFDVSVFCPRRNHFVAVFEDITERKRTEKELARLVAAVEQTIDLVVITGVDGVIQYVNPAFERFTGYTRAEAVGQTPRILKSGRQKDAFYQALWRTIQAGEVWSGRIINRRKDGTKRDHDVTITPVRDKMGAITNFVSVQRDVTESMLLESQLRQAQKLEAVGSLAAGIAHEINTPIQFVADNVRFLSNTFASLTGALEGVRELAQKAMDRPELVSFARDFTGVLEAADLDYLKAEIPKSIEQTLDGVTRVTKVVRAMKDFSHPDRGEKGSAEINRALLSTLTIAHNELKYVADVETDLDPTLPNIWCHLGDLNQAFLNLLVNAAHAVASVVGDGSSGKGTIRVGTRSVGSAQESGKIDGVLISISDTGTGIPEEIRDRVFEQFFTTKEVGRGTGQGLTITRAIVVDRHGGRIWFTTEVGTGTTFHIYLPVGAEQTEEPK
ncbi:MAG: PAS domain S-box protein [candidate division Zixibacteria bacterium]|nr:PAS domain S-box protein [candidate division Zixibacteria bacterium]